ncbi:BamA/TamA family outer membrane protein [Hymenobacter sp. NBH84]|uniref:BamA/TamA family outer membrane protein n=1 Tax=Hymenobacter sp. NBH84 TaxID=2596915 RepID=UPI0016277BD2|nr:BamA/TamA family outer membrane protein [Hymenobacter sp. NBH84]QNE40943.1 BamA/TamA family outer membrane protein [Hymenobacter sp. NBH84]
MYVRVLVFCLVGWLLSSQATSVWAQVTPTLPNQPGLQTPPLPPKATAPDSTAKRRMPRKIPRFVRLRTADAADQAVLRRYRYRPTAPDSLTALRTVREVVLALQANAYLTASADQLHWSRDTLLADLYVGEQFRWARLRNGNLGDALLTRAGYRERFFTGRPFVPGEWTRLQERILAEAENQGYPFATVRLDSVELRGNEVDGRVVLDRGPVIVFDSLEVIGATKTRRNFLIKYLQIFPNQPFSQQRVEAAAQLLRQLPYLQVKAEPEVRFARGRARVYLLLADRSANQFDAIVGVLPNPNPTATQNRVQLTGDVTINLRNIKGGGKQLGLQWRKVDAASQQLDAQYVHPNFFGTPLEVAGTFNLYRQNDAFLTIRPRLQVTYPTPRAGRLTVFTELRSSRLLDTLLDTRTTLPDNIDSEYTNYGLSYTWNSLDDLLFPRRGVLVAVQGNVGNKRISRNPELNEELYAGLALRSTQVGMSGRAERYYRVGSQGVLLTRVHGEALFNQRLFLNDLYRVGGLATLRGFNEFNFYASQYAVGTAEFRQFTGNEAYVFLFVDQAYIRRDLTNDFRQDAPTGLGAGLSFRTGAGLFQFVYSVGRTRDQSFSLNASKIHFGITSRF